LTGAIELIARVVGITKGIKAKKSVALEMGGRHISVTMLATKSLRGVCIKKWV